MRLALIAGQGGLPPLLVRAMLARGEVPLICEVDGFASSIQQGELPRLSVRLETFGTFLQELKAANVTRICMAGVIKRPNVNPSQIDAATLPLVPRVMAAMAKGDDGTLRVFIEIFEQEGFEVVGATDLNPELLPKVGVLSDASLPDGIDRDISAAETALAEMGAADLGQAVVIKEGKVIAREADAGTDALLTSLAQPGGGVSLADYPFEAVGEVLDSVADWLGGPVAEKARNPQPGQSAVLYKAPKPGQELRVDMPVIGVTTVVKAAEAGLAGIVIAAGGVMVIDLPAVLRTVNARSMFLWVRESAFNGPSG